MQQQPYGKSEFTGKMIGLLGVNLASSILSTLSLGIATPWLICWKERWMASHTYVDGRQLSFNGTGGQLFGNWIKWWLLSLVTLGVYSLWLPIKLEQWRVSHLHFSGASAPRAHHPPQQPTARQVPPPVPQMPPRQVPPVQESRPQRPQQAANPYAQTPQQPRPAHQRPRQPAPQPRPAAPRPVQNDAGFTPVFGGSGPAGAPLFSGMTAAEQIQAQRPPVQQPQRPVRPAAPQPPAAPPAPAAPTAPQPEPWPRHTSIPQTQFAPAPPPAPQEDPGFNLEEFRRLAGIENTDENGRWTGV